MATASTVAAAGRTPASRPTSQASPYAGRAAAIHTTRYPDANPASRQPRSSPKVRVYRDANGVTDGLRKLAVEFVDEFVDDQLDNIQIERFEGNPRIETIAEFRSEQAVDRLAGLRTHPAYHFIVSVSTAERARLGEALRGLSEALSRQRVRD